MSDATEVTDAAEEEVVASEVTEGVPETAQEEPSSTEVANEITDLDDQQLKRKRDEDGDEEANGKRAAVQQGEESSLPVAVAVSAAPAAAMSSISASGDNETISIAPDKVGQIIGTKGAVIQDMQTRTGAKIFLNQDFPAGVNRQVSISGTPAQVKAAGDLIKLILEHGPTAIHVNSMTGGPTLHIVIECPQSSVGRVIGSSGATIKELQSRTGAKIQIDQNFPEGVPRKINVSGTQTAITLATQLISYVMDNGPTLPPLAGGMGGGMMGGGGGWNQGGGAPSMQTYGGASGGMQHQVMDCAKAFVGKIIGRGGEVITMIQQRSGAKVQIDQNVPEGQPCKVNMSGTPQNLAIATQLVQEAMLGVKSQGGGMGQQGGYGGGGMGMQQPMQQYGMPQQQYGMPMQAQMPYGQQQQQQQQAQMPYGYGQPQQQQQQQYGQPAQQQYPPQQQAYTGYPAQVQAPIAKPVAASVWSEHKTDDGNTYWYNASTGVSQWERPVNA